MKGKAETPVRKHASDQASVLLRRMAFQAGRTSQLKDADTIHDLRVSVRRLTECLRVFDQFFPRERVKRVRRKLDLLMGLASEVRNRDIALVLLRRAAIPAGSPLVSTLAQERDGAVRVLREALKRWSRHGSHRRWRARLGL
jgi:CHAD domain-containing protein